MHLSINQLFELGEYAKRAANEASQFIASYAKDEINVTIKKGIDSKAASVVTEVDFTSQKIILDRLRGCTLKYNLGILTEELTDDLSRFNKDFFWCIDPLDGTLAFTENRIGYSVSIALVSKEGVPIIGVVQNPVTNELYYAINNLHLERPLSNKIYRNSNSELVCYFDRSFVNQPYYQQVIERLDNYAVVHNYSKLQVKTGQGAVMNACNVLQHSSALYFKFPKNELGGGSIWDFAATACLFKEANLFSCDILGNDLMLNHKENTFMNRVGVVYASNYSLMNFVVNLYRNLK